MNPIISRIEYYAAMRGLENNPASIKSLLSPFNIENVPDKVDEFLLIGHVIDAISAQQQDGFKIDAISIMELALDLGLDV
jgi:hypothetical protein